MKKKIAWIVLAVLLVALIGGASVLYDRLGSAYEVDQLATQAPVAPQTEMGQNNHCNISSTKQ